jgi:hypothetical protein
MIEEKFAADSAHLGFASKEQPACKSEIQFSKARGVNE